MNSVLPALVAAFSTSPAVSAAATPDVPDQDRAALIMIEFQNEWIDDGGKLRFLMEDQGLFDAAVEGGRVALETARAQGLPVFHVGLRFKPGYPELRPADHGLRAAIPRAGTWIEGSHGADFHEHFEPGPGEFVVSGRTGASAFSGSDLHAALQERGIETIYLAGFALHVCVESTLRDAHDLGYAPVVLDDATAAFSAHQREHVLEHVVHHFGEVVDNDEFERRMLEYAAPASPSERDTTAEAAVSRFDRGWERLRSIDGEAGERVINALKEVAPNLARYTIEFPFGDVFDPTTLDLRSREIATVAALTAMGNARPQLKVHMHAALNVGVSRGELVAVIEQMAVYAGFPAAINAAMLAKEVFEERGGQASAQVSGPGGTAGAK